MAVHIGTSGTPPRDRLAHYVARFDTVELNASCYRWPRDATFASCRRAYADLRWWADRVGEWAGSGRDVFVHFNNDGHGHAVRNALRLREFAGA